LPHIYQSLGRLNDTTEIIYCGDHISGVRRWR